MTEAMDMLEGIVEIRMKTLKLDHPDLLGSQHVLARAYLMKGENKAKTLDLLEAVVEIERTKLSANDPSRLMS